MLRPDTFSDYVEKLSAKLQDGTRGSQNLVLVRELADLRLQVQTLSTAIAALASYQEIAPLLRPPEGEKVARLPRRAFVDASQHLQMLDGFHAIEYTESGVAYRWTGPLLRFRFSVWVDRTAPVDATLSALSCGNPANMQSTVLWVDAMRYPTRWDEARNALVCEGILPRDFAGLSVFEFELARLVEDKDASDLRELGLPFRSFEAISREVTHG